jgi:hypothetical protein
VTTTTTDHMHVAGTGMANGPWTYAVNVPCQNCSAITYLSGTLPVAQAVVQVTINEDMMSMMRDTRYELIGGGFSAYQMSHRCAIMQIRPSDNQLLLHETLYRVEQKLNDRWARDAELERLKNVTGILQDKLNWVEQELGVMRGKRDGLFVQLAAVHEYLDCPCEMPLETTDLLGHLKDMHGDNA